MKELFFIPNLDPVYSVRLPEGLDKNKPKLISDYSRPFSLTT